MLAFNSTNAHDYYSLSHGYYTSRIERFGLDFALSVLLSELRKDYVLCKKRNKRFKNEFIDKSTQESYNLLMWKIKNGSLENIKSDKRYFEIRKKIFSEYESLKLCSASEYYSNRNRYFDSFFDTKDKSEVYHTCKNNLVIKKHSFEFPTLIKRSILENSIIKVYSEIFLTWIIDSKISNILILEKLNPYNINYEKINKKMASDFYSKMVILCNLMKDNTDLKLFKIMLKTQKLDSYFK